ncbi:MAG: electron transfer flavoprotein subunit alpha/FixB family protein [Deltaproteobacteria bacterium]|nr:electron transfer flavoprotein subunit alpha/FixB family protein [Deltaproteobacteria bacterium]
MSSAGIDIWVYLEAQEDELHSRCLGLLPEAGRLLEQMGGQGSVSAVVQGAGLRPALEELSIAGLGRVIYQNDDALSRYNGELFAACLTQLVGQHRPALLLMAHSALTQDLAPRVAASLAVPLVTRAVDFNVSPEGRQEATRPLGSGYLFQRVLARGAAPTMVSFLPSVLGEPEPGEGPPEIVDAGAGEVTLRTKVLELIEADPETLDLEEAEIIVAAGRGVGKDEPFEIVYDLARALGGSVGATRPVVDWGLASYQRQIGQTGKSVAPRLIINCGISGANEYTAGMEKSRLVIAINTDKKARIFRFADLGVIGDVRQVLPALSESINSRKGS